MTFKIPNIILVLLVLIPVAVLYYMFNPYGYHFPRCPVNYLTGLKCPGCGSQRAIHFLLHGAVYDALKENLLMVLAIPYLLLAGYARIQEKQNRHTMFGRKLYNSTAINIILIALAVFTLCRNLLP